MAYALPAISAGASILGGLFNRPTDPMQDWQRAWSRLSGITMGAENPMQYAQNAYSGFLGSPAYQGMQRNLFGQSQGFGNTLNASLANRGLLNSGLGNTIGALGQNLYGGNLANLQGGMFQNFLSQAPELFRLRGQLAGGIGPQRPSVAQGFGAGLQGLGGFGLNYLAMGGQNPFQRQGQGFPGAMMGQPGFQYPFMGNR